MKLRLFALSAFMFMFLVLPRLGSSEQWILDYYSDARKEVLDYNGDFIEIGGRLKETDLQVAIDFSRYADQASEKLPLPAATLVV